MYKKLCNELHYNYVNNYTFFLKQRSIKETFEKCSTLFKAKEGEDFNHRNTFSILRIKI